MELKISHPNIGKCEKKGEYSEEQKKECRECLSKEGMFYCEQCQSSMNVKQYCDPRRLVAKRLEQCEKPCYQVSMERNQVCSDDFDCKRKEICKENKCKEGWEGVL